MNKYDALQLIYNATRIANLPAADHEKICIAVKIVNEELKKTDEVSPEVQP